MEMNTRLLFVPLLIALVASLAACGGGTQVPANAIAVVGKTPITIAKFNDYFAQAEATTVAQGGQKPQAGTPQYTSMKNTVVAELVQIAEVEQQAPKEGVSVTPSDVDKYISNLVKTSYGGSMKKFTDALKGQGLTMKAAQQAVYIRLLATKIHDKVVATAKVTVAQEKAYYNANPSTHTTQPTLDIAASKKLANTIEQKLKHGASFAKLAKQYSQDPGSASQGGKYTATGAEVPAYQNVAFTLRTGQLSGLVDATSAANGGYGFFIIKALGPVKKTGTQKTRSVEHILVSVKTKPQQSTFKQVEPTIKQTLLQQAQQTLWSQWLSDLTKEYEGKVSYQASYAPPPTTTTLPATLTTPTG
jgi:foldase protein PrsA